MADESRSELTLDARWRSFWRHATRRWAYVRREARAQTLGMLVAVLVLMTLAALCTRTAYVLFRAYSSAVQVQIESAVAKGEPRVDIEYPAVTAAVLAPVNSHLEQWRWADRSPREACQAKQVLDVASQLMSAGLALKHDRAPGVRRNGTLDAVRVTDVDLAAPLRQIDSALLKAAPAGWSDSVKAHTRLLCLGDTGFVATLEPDSLSSPRRRYAQGLIGTQRSSRTLTSSALTRLLVPSSYVLRQRPTMRDTAWEELTTAAIASLYLEDAMRLCLPPRQLAQSSCDSSHSIVQIYFISERSVLRIFPARDPSKLPYNRYWAAAHYFQRFYDAAAADEFDYESPPYIDLGDQGVVRTLSRIVPSLNRSDSNGVFGLLCVDYRLPEDAFLDSLARHNVLFDLKVLRLTGSATLRTLQPGAGYELSEARVSPARRTRDGQEYWTRCDDPRLIADLAKYASGLSAGAENHSLGQYGGTEHPTFVLPLAVKPQRTFLIVTPRTPHMPYDVYVYGLFATALLVAAASMLFNWWGVARLQRERFENQTFRRNLPVGVMRLDHRDVILDANQIAEWAVDTTLQQEGEQGESDSERRKFGDLIFPWILPISGFNKEDGTLEFGKPVSYARHLKELREWPKGCSYCAVTRPAGAEVINGIYDAQAAKGLVALELALLDCGKVIQVSESPIIGEPPGRISAPDGTHRRPAEGAADTLGASTMVPRTDLILLSILTPRLTVEVRNAIRPMIERGDQL